MRILLLLHLLLLVVVDDDGAVDVLRFGLGWWIEGEDEKKSPSLREKDSGEGNEDERKVRSDAQSRWGCGGSSNHSRCAR